MIGKEELSYYIRYPLRRDASYPVPTVLNETEFQERYDEIFDSTLVQMIVKSNPLKDWERMDWNGISFRGGEIWLRLDEDNKIFVSTINYLSKAEAEHRNRLIEADRKKLHESLKIFAEPILVMETSTYKIRIDDMGSKNYRYASWKRNSPMSSKPDLILMAGGCRRGSRYSGPYYWFKNGDYTHLCDATSYIFGPYPYYTSAGISIYKNADFDDYGLDIGTGTEIFRQGAKHLSPDWDCGYGFLMPEDCSDNSGTMVKVPKRSLY